MVTNSTSLSSSSSLSLVLGVRIGLSAILACCGGQSEKSLLPGDMLLPEVRARNLLLDLGPGEVRGRLTGESVSLVRGREGESGEK